MTVTAPGALRLHVPEPPAQRQAWRDAVLDGAALEQVVAGDDGVASWLWRRWSALAGAGIDRDAFVALVLAYRRELWLWMVGDRTWEQCCSGLIGRIGRRLPA